MIHLARRVKNNIAPAILLEDGSVCLRSGFQPFSIDDNTSMELYGMPLPDEINIILAVNTQNKIMHHGKLLKEHKLSSLTFIDSTRYEPQNSFSFLKEGKHLDIVTYEEGSYPQPVAHRIFNITLLGYEEEKTAQGKRVLIPFIADFLLCNERCHDTSIVTETIIFVKHY
jgi:hypothetical protein